MSNYSFHPAVAGWFNKTFASATEAQQQAWPAIQQGQHTLIAAPTGSGKTLAAFLAVLDELVREGLERALPDETRVLYVSPLKALSNDIRKNLEAPLQGIADELLHNGLPPVAIRAAVRTGDTTQGERERMRKTPPHILVTTPESLYILLSSESGRAMLSKARKVIVDEIHALAPNKRGAHLALSLERLQALTNAPLTRIGLSATQKPLSTVAEFLVGNRREDCTIVDRGYIRERDLAIELPDSPLEAVMANEVWATLYDKLADLVRAHKTTLIFVNNRRLAERAARHLGERLDATQVAAHHGSLAREHRLDAEQRLKAGKLKVMVATASLELGIDIGDIDLVCQIGSPRSISGFLQRVGRAGHSVGGMPKARLFPTTRDDLVECAALLDAVRRDELDQLQVPPQPLEVLAQQIVAEVSCREWSEPALLECLRGAYPYRELSQQLYEDMLAMLADGFSTRRGRRSAYLHRDAVNGVLRGRKNARLTAIMNAGAIPDQFDYDVILEPEGNFIGSLNEDFAFESMAGDIFQLGNASYRILRVERGTVRVEDARGQPPTIPFWLGQAPGRSDELSQSVSRLRELIGERLESGIEAATAWLRDELGLNAATAQQVADYLAAAKAALNMLPTQTEIVFERFFDEAGDQHIVIHSPYGARLNRAWGLALRKKFCRKFNFELQAAALEDSIVISLGATHSFPLQEVTAYVKSAGVRETVTQAVLQAPLFMTRWRWVASIALAIQRNRNGRRVPAQFQRMDAEDLVAVVFPDQLACQDNIVGEREVPDHPLVNQTIDDCLNEAMDIAGLEKMLKRVESGEIQIVCKDLTAPSALAQEILVAKPYAFLDDAPAEERRTQAVNARRFTDPEDAAALQSLSPEAIAQVRSEAWPYMQNPDELHDALWTLAYLSEQDFKHDAGLAAHMQSLCTDRRATRLLINKEHGLHVCAERLPQWLALYPEAELSPSIQAAGPLTRKEWDADAALIDILRSRLEGTGPVGEQMLANELLLPLPQVQYALLALQQEGCIMQGHFDPRITELQWCERGLLARIHRYTLQNLREQIQPATTAEFMRFLFAWHGLAETRGEGEAAVDTALRKLEGFPIPAAAWEQSILADRIAYYVGQDLDALCNSGRFIWLRAGGGKTAQTTLKSTPIVLLPRESAGHWLRNGHKEDITGALSAGALRVYQCLQQRGAVFFLDIVQATGLLRTQVEQALAELAARGLAHADGFAGLRALITPPSQRMAFARRGRASNVAGEFDRAGRWSLISHNSPEVSHEDIGWFTTPYATLEHMAAVFLKRYGVVFRKLLQRETQAPPWRELLYVYRRMEARGEIRGGRFVSGHSGEQFALPEAVGLLRNQRRNGDAEQWVTLSAADPLNLSGLIMPGPRISATGRNRVLFRNGAPAGWLLGKELHLEPALSDQQQFEARSRLLQKRSPGKYVQAPAPDGRKAWH
ncbi:MAG TPA: DEAD/DEAH box helicase [Gammaproteobacteria bacterium]|nr:DEAD/DEAH box helicase [Gammaproteobacteria bacterium]